MCADPIGPFGAPARTRRPWIIPQSLKGLFVALALLIPGLLHGEAPAAEPMMRAIDPQDLLANMSRAAGRRDIPTYLGCLADSFRFTPYGAERVAYREVDWSHWDRNKEVEFVKRWLSPVRNPGLDLHDVLFRSSTGPDRAEWDLVYRMQADGEYRSRAIFVMVRRNHDWYLEEWIDTTIESTEDGVPYPTSGEARAILMR